MKEYRKIAIKDIPNAVEGWYKGCIKSSHKINLLHRKTSDMNKKLAERKKQIAMDAVFKEYIRKHHKDIYWEAVQFIQKSGCRNPKECGKVIKEMKVGTYPGDLK
jgi:hypothetical protein